MSKRTILRKILRAPADGAGVDALVADVLSVPTSSEAELLSAVRKSGADDSVEVVAVAARRTLVALAKAYRDAGRPVPPDVASALAGDDDEEDEYDDVDHGPAPGAWTTYDARQQIVDEDAENRRRKGGKRGDAAASSPGDFAASLSKEDARSLLEAIKDVLPEWRADAIRKERPQLTREQALAEVYTDPWLYSLTQRREAERIAKADAELRDRAARADRELRSLVASIRKADASLTEPQAWKAALDRRPDLYVPAPAPRFDPADAVIAKAERDAANTKYQRLADELRQRDGSLTAAQAFARAVQLHPEWYAG